MSWFTAHRAPVCLCSHSAIGGVWLLIIEGKQATLIDLIGCRGHTDFSLSIVIEISMAQRKCHWMKC